MTWLFDLDRLHGERALDVATGKGALARELAERYTHVVGVDVSAAALERAEPHPAVALRVMDAEALDFPDAHFDLVATSWSLHHFANPTRVIDEMHRVLAPGGIFLLIEPFIAETGNNQELHTEAHQLVAEIDRRRGQTHQPLFQRLQVGSVIQGLGLVEIEYRPLMQLAEEAGWDLARCRAAAEPWVEKLEAASKAEDLPAELRERAGALAGRLRAEGLRTSPVMRTYGSKPS